MNTSENTTTYEVKSYETFWKMGILMERVHGRNGREYARIEQKTGIYNHGKFACGANVTKRNLDRGNWDKSYSPWIEGMMNLTEFTI